MVLIKYSGNVWLQIKNLGYQITKNCLVYKTSNEILHASRSEIHNSYKIPE